MRHKPPNPHDPALEWDAPVPHDTSPDALTFLLAADEAAHTPERRQMLDGLLEGSDRDVRRVLESDVDHGDLLDEDFFWCFMGLAMCQGDRHFWNVVNDWGYSLDSLVNFSENESIEKSMSLACWGASFVEPERLDWLERIGVLSPWASTHSVGKWENITAGEVGMLKGSPAHFDYWLPKWSAHLHDKRLEFNRRNKVDVACNIPPSIAVLVGMMEWTKLPPNAHTPLPKYPEMQEMQRRLDAMLLALTDAFYPQAQPGEMLHALSQRPPRTEKQKVLSAVVRWAAQYDEDPFSKPVELEALKAAEFPWLLALVEQGAPLQRSPQVPSLGQAMLASYLHKSKPGSEDFKILIEAFKRFTQRCQIEQPGLLHSLWEYKLPNSTKTSFVYLEMQAIASKQWDKAHTLLTMGCPLTRENEPLQIGSLLLTKAVKPVDPDDDDRKNHNARTVLATWMERCAQEDPDGMALNTLWNTPVLLKGGGTTWPEHATLDAGKNEHLMAKILHHGCPLARRDSKGRELGFRLLRAALVADSTQFWEVFRERAKIEGGTSVPESYLNKDGDHLQASFAENPGQAKTALNAAELDASWGGTAAVAPQRPRF